MAAAASNGLIQPHHRQRNGEGVVTKGEAVVLQNGVTEIAL